METRISVADLKTSLEEVLKRVCEHGDSFVIEQDGRTLAALGPVSAVRGQSLADFLRGYQSLPRPDADFADDLEAIHASQPRIEPPSWDV